MTDARARRGEYVEALIARLLLAGGLVSIALVVVGLGLYAAHGGFVGRTIELRRTAAGRPGDAPVSFRQVVAGLTANPVDGRAVIALGLGLLLVTPVLGVAASIPGFLAAGDYRYASIAAVILAMLVLSVFFAGGAG